MNAAFIRRLDRWAGTPLCALLNLFKVFRRPAPEAPRRIVFIKLIEMGSSVLAVPAFREAADRVGKDNLFIVAFCRNRPILDYLDVFKPDHVLAVRDDNLWSFLQDTAAALSRIRRERIDTVIDFEGLSRASAILAFLSGAGRRVGSDNLTNAGPYRGHLFTHPVPVSFHHGMADQFLHLVRAAWCDSRQIPPLKQSIHVSQDLPRFTPAPAEIDALFVMLGLTAEQRSRPLIVINPGFRDMLPLRAWPRRNWEALVRQLNQARPVTVVVVGRAEEKDAAGHFAGTLHEFSVVPAAGQTRMRELLVLLDQADLLIASDSGPCHFAALTRTPTVALFGPETPQLYAPLNPLCTALWTGLACSPCFNILNNRHSACTDNQCMEAITVQEVAEISLHKLNPAANP